MSKSCPVCHSRKIEVIKLDFDALRHFGFENIEKAGSVRRCTHCQLLFNKIAAKQAMKLKNIYRSLEYAKSRVTHQTFFVPKYKKRVTRSFLQAEILQKYLTDSKDTAVLDIGCFNGELLLEISKRLPSIRLHGFDVNRHLKHFFPTKKNFHFWLSQLKNVKGKFDLISLSCSLMYIEDLGNLFNHIQRLLKPDGYVFIQMPNLEANPFSLLMGDQYCFFTPRILKNIFKKMGFELTTVNNTWFPREIMGIAKRLAGGKKLIEKDKTVYDSIKRLKSIRTRLRRIRNDGPLSVLGTTTQAAFVESVLGSRIAFFVDENQNRPNTRFRGKDVTHPRTLGKSVRLILPYGDSNKEISERFYSKYKLKNFEFV